MVFSADTMFFLLNILNRGWLSCGYEAWRTRSPLRGAARNGQPVSFLLSFLVSFLPPSFVSWFGGGTQGLRHSRPVLYHWAVL